MKLDQLILSVTALKNSQKNPLYALHGGTFLAKMTRMRLMAAHAVRLRKGKDAKKETKSIM